MNPRPEGKLQAIGQDEAGRWQYRYHASFVRQREQAKFERRVHFAEALPRMRAAIRRELREPESTQPALRRERVLACMLKILSTCFVRPGSQVYANEHGHYGLATLKRSHVHVHGHVVTFHFPGKAGKVQHRELRDPAVARVVRALLKMPSKQVFRFIGPDGSVHDVRGTRINQYIKEVMGREVTAKDFRTWAGTLVCASVLARVGVDGTESLRARRRKIAAAVQETAALLGNTPAVCRASYLSPAVLNGFEYGRVIESHFETVDELIEHRGIRLHKAEAALLRMLRSHARSQRAAARVIVLRRPRRERAPIRDVDSARG